LQLYKRKLYTPKTRTMSSPDSDNSDNLNMTFVLSPLHIDDDSDTEGEDWVLRGRYNRRRAARTDTLEADNSDSDGEPVPQAREPPTIGDLRLQIQQEAIQGDVSLADQAVFEEYFGDRYRRPTSPTDRGWQNTARIAAGARISNGIYGASINAIRDTTLVAPPLVSAGPPAGICASRRVQQQRIDAEAEVMRQNQEADRATRVRIREQINQASLGRLADECEDALRAHRRLSDLDVMRTELNARAMAFREQDPSGFDAWADHITVAHACSTSKSRQHQIVQWFTRGVPGRVLRQVRRVELYYTTEAYLQERLLEANVHAGARRAPDMRVHLKDDDRWAGNKKKLFFGYDPEYSVNGFADHVPKGEGVDIVTHLRKNWTARKIRLQHASAQHLPVLVDMMGKFIIKARAVLAQLEQASAGDAELEQLFRRAGEGVSQRISQPYEYQREGAPSPSEGASSPSEVGVRAAEGDDGNESDGSDFTAIVDEFANAARLLEARALEERDRAREDAFWTSYSGGEEGAGGNVPADGEDDDGSASMDEGSSP
jgi:hypothetical protein